MQLARGPATTGASHEAPLTHSSATLQQELQDSQRLNRILEEELAAASAEAQLARDALDFCAAEATAELAAPAILEAPGTRAANASAGEDAQQLAEALLAAEMALEAALVAKEPRQQAAEIALEAALVAREPGGCRAACEHPDSTSDASAILSDQITQLQEALAVERSQNGALHAEMAQRDALWGARARDADAQAESLRQSLADAWSHNALQADEFVEALAEVQLQLRQSACSEAAVEGSTVAHAVANTMRQYT